MESELEHLCTLVLAIAHERKEDTQALLALLRILESLHRQIREEMFLPSLPDSRRALYFLLRDIEESGGWPYIERMKLREFLHKLVPEETNP